ncbi:hypothetical protein J5I95_19440 [Candidatus Poribacteria bacterium]|nr:hypothetical protein [Candidatus Poribacteria bacterium]
MLKSTSAEYRFSQFCDEVDTLQYQIEKVIGNDDLFDAENAILDGTVDDAKIGYETARIRTEKTLAIWKLLQEFNPVLVPPMPRTEKKPADNRIIKRDVACRYLRIYGGETQWVQTNVDCGYPILIDRDGERRGQVSMFDKFRVPIDTAAFSEMPF